MSSGPVSGWEGRGPSWSTWSPLADLPRDRLAIGQLLGRLLREFRTELFAPAAEQGYTDLGEPQLHIFGNVGVTGMRLTDFSV